ncbi:MULTISPECIES: DEAD/DEAH box helicase [Vibrio]|uniref:DEAD/DEAH box helicase n=1 Tax=Vibrio TaxID=662 RepID=UPI00031F0C35|nr:MULTISPECIES: ATP-binding domain-containing protein [Vibrio]MDH5933959.1 ATP-binding domain-containing protein [Vibrio splendidus]OEF82872.1 DNA helicase [Vibrio tasmaniensis 1F-155]
MDNSYFFLQVEQNVTNQGTIETLRQYATEERKQMYLIDRPLGDSKYSYGCDNILVVLIPESKITFINLAEKDDDFQEFIEDFLEDLGSISDKYRYKEKIGRPRKWRKDVVTSMNVTEITDSADFFSAIELTDHTSKRTSELLISLLTGSINDINKVSTDEPLNILERVKRKILLFDGDQTRFIYQKPSQKVTTIQGMSGTGKTELLLHKLKEIYLNEDDPKILLTCHNHILAESLSKRIPDFFDFMKVEQQILWNEKLWCVNAWGSSYDKNSGAYAYITSFYKLQFQRYNRINGSFDAVCTKVLNAIQENNLIETHGFAFDYILIDESQDFPDSFLQLCKICAKQNVYIAGDFFQSIFNEKIISEIQPDFLLSKCYRTDPRTLMFAHALGMGLFETPKLRWLEDREWVACGYEPKVVEDNKLLLTREPLRRFEDIVDTEHSSIELVDTSAAEGEDAHSKILEIIQCIKDEYETVSVNDIGIIFIDRGDYVYSTADKLMFSINKKFGWEVNKAFESKKRIKETLFVSNTNNVKGLEFPFVICVTKKITQSRSYRNALYMMLTRSFLKSYLLVNKEVNHNILGVLNTELETLNKSGELLVSLPSKEEIEQLKTTFNYTEVTRSFYDVVNDKFDELEVSEDERENLYEIVKRSTAETVDEDKIEQIIRFHSQQLPLC